MSFGTVQAEKMTTESGYSLGAGNASSFKNRVINGQMWFDQKLSGASRTLTNDAYPADHWQTPISAPIAGDVNFELSSTAPAGFSSSAKFTVATANTTVSNDYCLFWQKIEGYLVQDLMWGTASAKPVVLSFWVRSSLTGTFGGSIENASQDRAFPFTYTISSANTWEQKTVAVTGDTTGTWEKTTATGIRLNFSLAAGSGFTGTPNTWATAQYLGATGQTNITETLNATWYVTGVQLEVGTVATSFDTRDYDKELILCQRYINAIYGANGLTRTTTQNWMCGNVTPPMRGQPSISLDTTGTNANRTYTFDDGQTGHTISAGQNLTLVGTAGQNGNFVVSIGSSLIGYNSTRQPLMMTQGVIFLTSEPS